MFKVKFVVHSNTKQSTFTMRVVGNLPVFGSWNPQNGLQMEQYDDGQWESTKHIEIPNGHQFQFKLVKLYSNGSTEWQQLPNNSNRKFKPKFHTKLILKWSNHIGHAVNDAKSSLKFKGLPGVMVNGQKQVGMLKRKPKNNRSNLLSDSDSESQNQNDSFCVGRKKSSDIRQSISAGDIQQIYYDTTELQNAYHHYKQIQVNIISSQSDLDNKFIQRIEKQLKQLYELQNYKFKWLLLSKDEMLLNKFKKIGFKKVQNYHNQNIYLQQYVAKNVHKCHFIFIDVQAALKTVIGNVSACLYLSSSQFEKVTQNLKKLQKFHFICFDCGETNKKLLQILQQQKVEGQKNDDEKNKLIKQKNMKQLIKIDKNFETISIQKILQQLQCCEHEETSVNTVQSFTRNEALATILQQNSILLVDSQLMKIDKKFFDNLLNQQCEKRLIIIIHKTGVPEWLQNYSMSKNICVILDNFNKLYFLGKKYDPSKKHRDAIQFIQMRARLFQKQNGGSWVIQDNSFTFKFVAGTMSKANNIKNQIQNVLLKDYNYFKLNMKENRLKITWNLSHPMRLLRTLTRIKFIEQGKIGNFYIVSYRYNVEQLKQQLLLLVMTNHLLMIEGRNTLVLDFAYGNLSGAKFTIKAQGMQTSQSTSSTSSVLSKQDPEQNKNRQKLVQFLQHRNSNKKTEEQEF